MTKRTPIPPADILFSGQTTTRPRQPLQPVAEPLKHVKVTYYMPPGMVADLDELRVELQRLGVRVDRGQLVRAAVKLAQKDVQEWSRLVAGGEGDE